MRPGFGVIAENTWAAFNAADAIEVEWGAAEYPADNAGDPQGARRLRSPPTDRRMRDDGDVDAAFADAPREKLIEAEYFVPYLAHTCMEPLNATARCKDGVLDIWSPSQIPTLVR